MLGFEGMISALNQLHWDFSFKFSDLVSLLAIIVTFFVAYVTYRLQKQSINFAMYEERNKIGKTLLSECSNIYHQLPFDLNKTDFSIIEDLYRVQYFFNSELASTTRKLYKLREERQRIINKKWSSAEEEQIKNKCLDELSDKASYLFEPIVRITHSYIFDKKLKKSNDNIFLKIKREVAEATSRSHSKPKDPTC
jgi:hypothetical protein